MSPSITHAFSGAFLFLAGFLTVTPVTTAQAALTHLWSQHFGDAESQAASDVATDLNGNVIVTGEFFGSVDFGGGDIVSAGGRDIFVAKFNPQGAHQWSRGFGDAAPIQEGIAVATDLSGNVIIAGSFEGTVDFGGGTLTSGYRDAYVAKFDAAGVHQWSQRFGDALPQECYDVATDASGNIFITGTFSGTVDFGGGVLSSAGVSDIYVAKFDAAGVHQWSQRFGDATLAALQVGKAVATDPSGNVFVTGGFDGSVDFGGGDLVSAGGFDVFIAKFNSAGVHLWSKRFGDFWEPQHGYAVATDQNGNVVVTGAFFGTLNFGGENLTSAGHYDIYIAKLDAAGSHLWSQRFGDEDPQSALSVVTDANGDVVVTGHFSGTVDFGGGDLTSANAMFVAKFNAAGIHEWSQRFGGAYGASVATDGNENVVATGGFAGTVNFGGQDLVSAGGDIFIAKFAESPPVPVAISDFVVSARADGIDLDWRVTADESFAGFRVYRAVDSSDLSDFTPLEGGLLPSSSRAYRDESVTSGNRYAYFVAAVMPDGREIRSPIAAVNVSPLALALEQNVPNPFNPSTRIAFTLPTAAEVDLSVYTVDGRMVQTLQRGRAEPGRHEAQWNGSDARGESVGSGLYLYRLRAGKAVATRKMLLLK